MLKTLFNNFHGPNNETNHSALYSSTHFVYGCLETEDTKTCFCARVLGGIKKFSGF